jgi:polyhydroxybutyrate depolymerase
MRQELRTIDVDGASRRYLLVEPAAMDPAKAYALVLVLHGDGGDARGFHTGFPFERASGGEAILAYLEGVRSTWDLEARKGSNKDVRFATRVVEELTAARLVDRARVFAAGYSSGGFFANVLACHEPGLLRAIASNAGGAPYKQAEKWGNGYPKCPGQLPTATIALHGGRDFAVTIDSGRFSAAYWAYVNGCDTGAMETTGYDECHAYRGCPAGKPVAWCEIGALDHWVWERSAEASWSFFERVVQAR